MAYKSLCNLSPLIFLHIHTLSLSHAHPHAHAHSQTHVYCFSNINFLSLSVCSRHTILLAIPQKCLLHLVLAVVSTWKDHLPNIIVPNFVSLQCLFQGRQLNEATVHHPIQNYNQSSRILKHFYVDLCFLFVACITL